MKRGLDNHADRQQGDEDLEGNKEKLFGNFLPEFRAGIRAGDHRYNHQQYEQQVRAKANPRNPKVMILRRWTIVMKAAPVATSWLRLKPARTRKGMLSGPVAPTKRVRNACTKPRLKNPPGNQSFFLICGSQVITRTKKTQRDRQKISRDIEDDTGTDQCPQQTPGQERPKDITPNILGRKSAATGIAGKLHHPVNGNDSRRWQENTHDGDQQHSAAKPQDCRQRCGKKRCGNEQEVIHQIPDASSRR